MAAGASPQKRAWEKQEPEQIKQAGEQRQADPVQGVTAQGKIRPADTAIGLRYAGQAAEGQYQEAVQGKAAAKHGKSACDLKQGGEKGRLPSQKEMNGKVQQIEQYHITSQGQNTFQGGLDRFVDGCQQADFPPL